METLQNRLKYFRKRNNLNQEKIADIIGVARTTYAGYEKDREPPISILISLSRFYETTLDSLIGNQEYDTLLDNEDFVVFLEQLMLMDKVKRQEYLEHINEYSTLIRKHYS